METSEPLASESFSYSWLVDTKCLHDGRVEAHRVSVDSLDEATSQQICDMVRSRRPQSFDFDVPISRSPPVLVHADELFHHGSIRPARVDSVPPALPIVRIRRDFPGKLRELLPRILAKYFVFLKLPRLHGSRPKRSSRADNMDRRAKEVESWNGTLRSLPTAPSADCSAGSWSDTESLIYDAVLHCKRSIET